MALTALAAALVGATALGISTASAHPDDGQTLAERIATRFTLSKNEVQHVVDEV